MPWAIEDYDSDRKSPPFSALIMNPESGAYFAMDLFVIGPRFSVFSPFQLCLDCALTARIARNRYRTANYPTKKVGYSLEVLRIMGELWVRELCRKVQLGKLVVTF